MAITERIPPLTPTRIAIVYAVVGSVWILVSDQAVNAAITNTALETYVQTVKGLIFVGVSAVLVYWLVAHSRHELERTNDRLDVAIQQSSILHRILRHNLRNTCNVIRGHAQLLRHEVEDDRALDIIDEAADELVTIGEKTRRLRDVVLSDPESMVRLDAAEAIESQVATASDRYPAAAVRADLPDAAPIETHPALGIAVFELIENAVEHNDDAEPTVRVSATVRADEGIDVAIADDGPGLPEMEREVLEAGMEEPTFHSEGLGLWLARTIVVQAGGDFRITDADPRGTVVGMSLPATATDGVD